MCALSFIREPLAEWVHGLRLAWMQGMCSLFDAPNRPWRSKGFERITITIIFCRDFALWIWLDRKDRHTGQGWTSLGPRWLSWVPSTRLHSQVLMLFTSHLWRRIFGQRTEWSKGHGNHLGQDETAAIICSFALSAPWRFYSWEQLHGDSQRHWWCPWFLMLLVITRLSRTYSASW